MTINGIDSFIWNNFLSQVSTQNQEIHLLQTAEWGELKAAFGWQVEHVIADQTGAQVLIRPLIAKLNSLSPNVAYIPRGPIGKQWELILEPLDDLCRRRNVAFLKIEADLWEDTEEANLDLENFGLRSCSHAIQPPRTVIIDIHGDEEQILTLMKQKTRYNIRLAQKKGVVIRPLTDIKTFKDLMDVTGKRDGFGVHSQEYYQMAYDLFHKKIPPQSSSLLSNESDCEMLFAEYEGTPLAALMVFACGKRSFYLYGASNDLHRERMPTYLLQWEAIRWARSRGCTEYDLWGIPDAEEETLENNFLNRQDGLWGVYRFKRGFNGTVKRSAGPWDRVYNPFIYRLYQWRVNRQEQSLGN